MIIATGYNESGEEVFRCEDPWDFGQQEANELFGFATRVVVDRDGQRQTLTPEKIPAPPSDDSPASRTVLDLLSPEDRAAVEATLEKASPRVSDAIQAIRLLANAPIPGA